MRNPGKRADPVPVHAPACALVSLGRIGEAVAEYASPRCERRADHFRDVARARRKHDEQFRRRIDRAMTRFEHQRSQFFGERRAARFAGHERLDASRAQVSRGARDLGRLADALRPLERDESAAHDFSVPERPGRRAGWPGGA